MTLPALASAREVVFLVTGESKADAVAAAFGPGRRARAARAVVAAACPQASEITVLLDRDAAAKLDSPGSAQ